MRLLQPDLQATETLPLHPQSFPHERSLLLTHVFFSHQRSIDCALNHEMARPHTVIPRCHCLRQGVAL